MTLANKTGAAQPDPTKLDDRIADFGEGASRKAALAGGVAMALLTASSPLGAFCAIAAAGAAWLVGGVIASAWDPHHPKIARVNARRLGFIAPALAALSCAGVFNLFSAPAAATLSAAATATQAPSAVAVKASRSRNDLKAI